MQKHSQPVVNSDMKFVTIRGKEGKQLLVRQLVLQ